MYNRSINIVVQIKQTSLHHGLKLDSYARPQAKRDRKSRVGWVGFTNDKTDNKEIKGRVILGFSTNFYRPNPTQNEKSLWMWAENFKTKFSTE